MSYYKVINLLLFQAIWFTAAFGQSQYLWILGLLLGALVILPQHMMKEIKVVLLCGGLGIAMDSVLALSGILIISDTNDMLPIPMWFMAIWLGFAATFRHSLNAMLKRPLLMVGLAVVVAPLNYIAGARLGALEFGLPTLQSAMVISFSWLVVTPMLIKAYRFAVKELEAESSAEPSWFSEVEQGRKS